MPRHVIRRPGRGTLQITGIVRLPDGRRIQVRRRAGSSRIQLAQEEAAAIEAQILRDAYHGERRGSRTYAEALESYLNAAPRGRPDQQQHTRILRVLGDIALREVNQEAVNKVRRLILRPEASPATILRGVISPILSVLNYAAAQDWCNLPRFIKPRQPQGRTHFLLPNELERLVAAAAPHLKGLLLFLADTGARLSEAIELDWLMSISKRVNFYKPSGAPRLAVPLSPRTVAALAALAHREGAWSAQSWSAYADKERRGGRSSALSGAPSSGPVFTPDTARLRHSWASGTMRGTGIS